MVIETKKITFFYKNGVRHEKKLAKNFLAYLQTTYIRSNSLELLYFCPKSCSLLLFQIHSMEKVFSNIICTMQKSLILRRLHGLWSHRAFIKFLSTDWYFSVLFHSELMTLASIQFSIAPDNILSKLISPMERHLIRHLVRHLVRRKKRKNVLKNPKIVLKNTKFVSKTSGNSHNLLSNDLLVLLHSKLLFGSFNLFNEQCS